MSDLLSCNAVTAQMCEGSVRERGDGVKMRTCYRCGLPVCGECSSMQKGRVLTATGMANRSVRMCDTCLGMEPDGAARVLLRRYHEAGYPAVTLEQTRAEVTHAANRAAADRVVASQRAAAASAPEARVRRGRGRRS